MHRAYLSLASINHVLLIKVKGKSDLVAGKSSVGSKVENLALNSLLELFTAKTSLNEIDFNLLIASTQASLGALDN